MYFDPSHYFPRDQLTGGSLPKIDYEKVSAKEIVDWGFSVKHPASVKPELSQRFFEELEGHANTLKEYIPSLKKIFNIELPKKSASAKDANTIKFFIRDLAKKIRDEADKVREYPKLSDKKKEDIIEAANQYLNCRDALAIIHDTLVSCYFDNHPDILINNSNKIDDLIQEARTGIIDAIDRFAPELNFKFSQFAFKCIHTRIVDALLVNGSSLSFSRATGTRILKIYKKINTEEAATGTYNLEKIAEELHMGPKTARRLLQASKASIPFSCLDKDEERDTSIGSIPAREKSPAEELEDKETKERKKQLLYHDLQPIINELSEIERYTLAALYGIGEPPKSPKEISKILFPQEPPSRYRVELILNTARAKILTRVNRRPTLMAKISDLLFNGRTIPKLKIVQRKKKSSNN